MITRSLSIPVLGMFFGLMFWSLAGPQQENHSHQDGDGHNHPKQPERLEWNASRKLSWKDYKAQWNNTRPVEVMSLISTFYNHFQSKSGDTVIVETMPIFYPEDSYVKPELKTKERLFHEQTKFDLYEVWARKLRKDFANYSFSKASYSSFMQSMYKANLMARNQELAKYNNETNGGKNAANQKTWADKISKQLVELNKYKDHTVLIRPK